MKIIILQIIFTLPFFLFPIFSEAKENCIYTTKNGIISSTSSIDKVPEEFKESARCFNLKTDNAKNNNSSKKNTSKLKEKTQNNQDTQNSKILNNKRDGTKSKKRTRSPRADKVSLNKSKRQKILKSALGKVNLRWEASVEKYIGRPPVNDVNKAMKAAARVIGQKSLSPNLKELNYDWRVVIMGKVPRDADTTVNGEGVCHPGWIRRGSDIYISLERIATSCGRIQKTESETITAFRETLIHEIGHAIEYKILGRSYSHSERWHREGFAMWFESVGADYLTGKGNNRTTMRERVKRDWDDSWKPSSFNGQSKDYTRGYALIATVAEKKSVFNLKRVYDSAARNRISLLKAVEKELNWPLKIYYKKVRSHFDS